MDSRKREKFLQRIIHLEGLSFVKSNNLDFSCEPDEGRGPVDFKISRGLDKTIIEVKLSSNQQYLHGYEVQVGEYGKAENTDQMIYVLIDLGNPGRIKKLKETHNKNIKEQIKAPELIIINGTEKASASIYDDNDSFNHDIADFNISEIETTFDEIDVFDFDNIIDLKDTDC